jgi:hypothetical protein
MEKIVIRLGRLAAVAVVGVFLSVAGAQLAVAKGEYKYWPSSGNLSVSGYGSTAYARGQWRVADSSNGTRSWLDSYTSMSNADDHRKFTHFQTQSATSSGGPWSLYAESGTVHSNNENWEWLYANTGVNPSGSYARARVKVCLDIPLRSDPCSGYAVTGATSY